MAIRLGTLWVPMLREKVATQRVGGCCDARALEARGRVVRGCRRARAGGSGRLFGSSSRGGRRPRRGSPPAARLRRERRHIPKSPGRPRLIARERWPFGGLAPIAPKGESLT